ncbi:hypothetical protein Tco_1269081 [Tanacetum coccineum]
MYVISRKVFWVRAKEISGWVNSQDQIRRIHRTNLYDLLNKKKDENNKGDCVEDSLKFPPGFTPKDSNEVIEERPNTSNESKRVSGEGVHSFQEEDTGVKKHGSKKKAKDDVVESMCPGHFQKAETPRSGGSILQSMDDMVKVG